MSMSAFHRFASLLLAVFVLVALGAVPASGSESVFETDVLHYIEHKVDEPGLDGAHSVAVSPDGKHVYVVGYRDDAITVFARADTGKLTFVQVVKYEETENILNGPKSVTVSPDGKHVYVACYLYSAVVGFSRDEATGVLTFADIKAQGMDGVEGLSGAAAVAISPSGGRVYVAGQAGNTLAVFFRNPATGELTFWQVLEDGIDGVDGLETAISVAVSPDGKHIYVAGYRDNAVAIFEWGTSGPLPWLYYKGLKQDGVGGVDGLYEAMSVAVSPDGKHVYVAGSGDHAVAAFARNSANGGLTFVGATVNGVDGVEGLAVAVSVAVSPDGEYVYVASRSSALAVLARDDTTGSLTFAEAELDGVNGVDGLYFAYGVAVSPDSQHVYVASSGDNAVAVFGRPYMVYMPIALRNH
jgi:DNA-binding beta-propeller fold protein YncE